MSEETEQKSDSTKSAAAPEKKSAGKTDPSQGLYTAKWLVGLTRLIQRYYPNFDSESFLKDVRPRLIDRPLRQRITATARALGPYMPDDYRHSLAIIRELTPRIPNKMAGMFIPEYIGIYGGQDWDRSMQAFRFLTTLFPSEYGVRHFFEYDFERTMEQLKEWTEEDKASVRRLAALSSRPLLPETPELPLVRKAPQTTWDIVEALKTDSSPSVRRAVTDHVRDIAELHPDWLLEELQKWDLYNPKCDEIAKRATRAMYRARVPGAFALLGYDVPAQVKLENFRYKHRDCPIGERQAFAFEILSRIPKGQRMVVDFKVFYLQEDGTYESKIHRLKSIDLGPKATKKLQKRKAFRSTKRKPLIPGQHRIEILVNGESQGAFAFNLVPPKEKKAEEQEQESKAQSDAAKLAAEVGGYTKPTAEGGDK